MKRIYSLASIAACVAALACDRRSDVQQETQDLREARGRVGSEVSQIEEDLAEAKAEVVKLEEKLALARQGITDDVMKERKDVEQSLKSEQREVQGEINEARREAQVLDRNVDQATRELEGTQPPHVESKVSTETRVTEQPRTQVEQIERREVIPVRGTTTTTEDAGTRSAPPPDLTPGAPPR